MRKASIFATVCMALAAMVALSVPAVTAAKSGPGKQAQKVITIEAHDPYCNQYGQYGGQFGVFDLAVSTPDSNREHTVSGVVGAGAACGSIITCQFDTDRHYCVNSDFGGESTLNDYITMTLPPGPAVTPAFALTDRAYVGAANVNVLYYTGQPYPYGNPLPGFYGGAHTVFTVDKSAGTDCPADAIACYKGVTIGGYSEHNWQWVTEDPVSGRNVLTIGPFYNDSTFTPAGLTKINTFALCAYEGDVGGNACGDSHHKYIQANGDASAPDCNGGAGPAGIYSVTVTNKGGATTAPATACVPWIPVSDRFPPNIEELD